ncbi:MAG: hypothetical protein HQM07_01355 [Zetaproteobacteria bacterium]|nr:hypothetical protein [Zetaproteobacteria bacterium]
MYENRDESHYFLATTYPGLEHVAAKELPTLGAVILGVSSRGVRFQATVEVLYRIHLYSRTISRVWHSIDRFTVAIYSQLERKILEQPWAQFLYRQQEIKVEINSDHSILEATKSLEQKIIQTIRRKVKLPSSECDLPAQTILLDIRSNRCDILLDTSGVSLEIRDYQPELPKATANHPTLAASLLYWMAWKPYEPLVIPMCSSGIIAIEAVKLAHQHGHVRDFAFQHWPAYDHEHFELMAKDRKQQLPLTIDAWDNRALAFSRTQRNVQDAGVADEVNVQQAVLVRTAEAGVRKLLVCNFVEVVSSEETTRFYGKVGELFRRKYADFKAVIVIPDSLAMEALRLPVIRSFVAGRGIQAVTVAEVDLSPQEPDLYED